MQAAQLALEAVAAEWPAMLERFQQLLRFPSIGTDPAFHPACIEAAEWLKRQLAGLGAEARLDATTGQPVVIGQLKAQGPAQHVPHILFYGHYDVQPADPLDLWQTPPFEPTLRKGSLGQDAIFARGASDDKGQLLTFAEAVRIWRKVHGALPFDLTFLLEGDEEGDSSHLDRYLAGAKSWLKPDVALICDTELWNDDTPALVTRLRGVISEDVVIDGPRLDLHSGYYGGPAANPIHVLTAIMAALHDARGKVTVPGFYDGVKPVSKAERARLAAVEFPAQQYLANVGLSEPAGETGYSALEQLWLRPTLEFNGIIGGYTGAGSKTVLPSKATGKFSMRLVGGQDPKHVRRCFQRFVKSLVPKDCKVSFYSHGGDSTGITVAEDSPWIQAAARGLEAEWGRKTVLIGCGASIPVVESFKKHLKVDSVLAGFAREADSVHSPNEKYDVESFQRGIRSWIRIIGELAKEVKQ